MINKVIHKTSIKLDEVGTEAAAITLIGMETAPSPPTIFRADHPFLYAIVERTTGAIMFLGKYGGD
jgi:serpin B